jgi:hypothetical protein
VGIINTLWRAWFAHGALRAGIWVAGRRVGDYFCSPQEPQRDRHVQELGVLLVPRTVSNAARPKKITRRASRFRVTSASPNSLPPCPRVTLEWTELNGQSSVLVLRHGTAVPLATIPPRNTNRSHETEQARWGFQIRPNCGSTRHVEANYEIRWAKESRVHRVLPIQQPLLKCCVLR